MEAITQSVALDWSPDGQGLALAVGEQIWEAATAGEVEQRYNFAYPGAEWGALKWSPDGSGYLLALDKAGYAGYLYWFPAEGGEPVLLLNGQIGDVAWVKD